MRIDCCGSRRRVSGEAGLDRGWLGLLVILPLLAKAAVRWSVDRPCHVVFAQVVGELAVFLCLFLASIWRDLFPRLVFLLAHLVGSVLLVLHLLTTLVVASLLVNIHKLFVELEMPLEGIEGGKHGNDLLCCRKI